MATSPTAPKAPRKRKARVKPWTQPALTGAVPANDDALDAFLGPGSQLAPTQTTTTAAPDAKRVTGGRRARRCGVEFEQWMHGQLDAAVLVGRLAHYHPIWPEAGYERAPDGKGGWRFELVWKADAHADVAGVLTDGRVLDRVQERRDRAPGEERHRAPTAAPPRRRREGRGPGAPRGRVPHRGPRDALAAGRPLRKAERAVFEAVLERVAPKG